MLLDLLGRFSSSAHLGGPTVLLTSPGSVPKTASLYCRRELPTELCRWGTVGASSLWNRGLFFLLCPPKKTQGTKNDKGRNPTPKSITPKLGSLIPYRPWDWYIYLHECLTFMVFSCRPIPWMVWVMGENLMIPAHKKNCSRANPNFRPACSVLPLPLG